MIPVLALICSSTINLFTIWLYWFLTSYNLGLYSTLKPPLQSPTLFAGVSIVASSGIATPSKGIIYMSPAPSIIDLFSSAII